MVKMGFLKSYRISIVLGMIVVAAVIFAGQANAAILYFSPSSGNFTVGNIFTVSALVNTQNKAINSAEAVLNFPTDFLEVVSISKSGSIFSLWVEEPAFSNGAGTISLVGGLPTPGFNGSAGNIINMVFRAKRAGSASLVFSSAAVRANDGYGTDILQNRVQAQFTIISEERPAPSLPTVAGVPAAPKISSPTHPDPEKWYSDKNPVFVWDLPSDVTAVKLLIDREPTSLPTFRYEPPISTKKIEDLPDPDGVRYFHARFMNKVGWGATAHYKVMIDTQPPEPFEARVDNGGDATNPQPILYFKAEDKTSGISHYELRIGTGDVFPLPAEEVEKNPYKMPLQAPGSHPVLAKAVDKAGNTTLTDAEAVIASLEPPRITEYPEKITTGEILSLKGVSDYLGGEITVFIESEDGSIKEGKTFVLEGGSWSYVHSEILPKGLYQIWAKVKDKRGAVSLPSTKITTSVSLPTFLKIGRMVIDYLTIMVTLTSLILLLILATLYAWYRISLWRKRLRKETEEAEESVTEAFRTLNEKIEKQVAMLDENPDLSEREREIRDNLKDALEASEKIISKEIKDIEKELE